MGEVITFTSGKGGVGKTTTTANVGVGLSLSDKKVVLVDTDIGLRNLDVVMGLENRILYNLVDVLSGRCRLKQALIHDRRYPGLYVIPSPCTRDANVNISKQQMKHLLDDLRMDFDYILIDSPAGIGSGFSLATFDADRIIIVTTPQIAAIHDADRVISILKQDKEKEKMLLVNSYDRQMVKAGNMLRLQDIKELFEPELLGVVYSDANIIISQNQGVPLAGGNTPAARCYDRIARRIMGEEIEIQDCQKHKRKRWTAIFNQSSVRTIEEVQTSERHG
jgi:septum site-determining protein MinD